MKYILIMMWVFNWNTVNMHPMHGDYYQLEFSTLEQCEATIKALRVQYKDFNTPLLIAHCAERGLPT